MKEVKPSGGQVVMKKHLGDNLNAAQPRNSKHTQPQV